MSKFIIFIFMAALFGFGKSKAQNADGKNTESKTEDKGVIGRYYEDENPVIVKFVNELPSASIMSQLPFLTVVSWKYDGSQNNGMPNKEVNERMISLENAIEGSTTDPQIFRHVNSRTGNNLKEIVFYSTSQAAFMSLLNQTLNHHEPYPIEIDFYEDKEWREFKAVLKDFSEKK